MCLTLISINRINAQIDINLFIQPNITGSNMFIGFNSPNLNQFTGSLLGAFYDINYDGSMECVGLTTIENGFSGLALWGDDMATNEIDGLSTNQVPSFWILTENNDLISISNFPPDFNGFITNDIITMSNTILSYEGCNDNLACNYYNLNYEIDNFESNCIYQLLFYNCDSVCNNDVDNDLICDELEIPGCTNSNYFEFNIDATDDDGSCISPIITGCTNSIADNFNINANYDDGSCIIYGCTYNNAINYNPNANFNDGSCEIYSCLEDYACNTSQIFENANFVNDSSLCIFPQVFHDCSGNCINDIDGDLICDELEVPGCQNPLFTEYNPTATDNDNSCNLLWEEAYSNIENLNDSISNVNLTLNTNLAELNDNYNYQNSVIEELNTINFDLHSINSNLEIEISNLNYNIDSLIIAINELLTMNLNLNNLNDSLILVNNNLIFDYLYIYNLADSLEESNITLNYLNENLNYQNNLFLNENLNLSNINDSVINLLEEVQNNYLITVNINEGWNMFGYCLNQTHDIDEFMTPFINDIIIIKDINGNAYFPEYNFNNIINLTPGHGYLMKSESSFILNF